MLPILAPLLVLAHPGHQSAPPNPGWNCDDPIAQQEMNWCAAEEYRAADAELNRQWAKTSARMKERDAGWDDSVAMDWDKRPGWFDSLLEAQRAWIAYRDAHCRLDGYEARGGSLEPLLVSTCKTALTKERTEQLRSLADSSA